MTSARSFISAALIGLALATTGCSDSTESLLAKAKQAMEKKETKEAEIHLKNLLQKGENAEARFLLGQVYVAGRDFKSAERDFQKALEGGYDPVRTRIELVEALLSSGETAKAQAEARKITAVAPIDKAKVNTLLGRALLATGKREDAEAQFKAAVADSPDYIPAQLGLISMAAGKDIKSAASQIDSLLAKTPQSLEAMSLKGDLEVAQGHAKEASAIFAKIAAAEPQNSLVRAKLVSLAIDSKDYTGAQTWLDELKKITGPASGTMHLQALNDFRQGKYPAARDAIQTSLKVGPNYVPALALASSIHLSMNSLPLAELNARSVIEKAPNSTLGYRLLGTTYLRMNAPDRAMQTVAPILERGTKDPVIYGIAGEAALKLNDANKAAAYFSKAVELAPNDPGQKAGRGIARIAFGDKDGGVADLEAAIEASPDTAQADLALITSYLRDKQWDKALAAIDRLEKKQPKSPLAANLRGSVALGKNDPASARKHFEEALVQDPTYFAAAANLANLDLRDKKVDDAKKRYTRLLEKDPKNVRALLTLAQITQATGGDRKQVLEWLNKARDADKGSVAAAMAIASFYMTNNEPKEAIPALQEAITASPENIQLLDALGTAYLKAGDDAQAISTFEKILRTKPDSAPLHLRMGEFYLGRNDYDRAMTHFRKSAELAPKALEPRVAISNALIGQRKFAEARALATALSAEAPKSAAGAMLEGDAYAAEKKYGEAAAAYRKGLAIQKAAAVSVKLHRVLLLDGKEAEAEAVLKSLLADNPKDFEAKSYAAATDLSRKRWPQAIALYKEIVAAQPGNALALNNLAWALHETKDPGALAMAEKAYALAPKSAPVLDTYGTVLLAKGETAKAVDILKQAVAAAPRAYDFRVRLASALIAKGDKSDAKKELELVLGEVKSGPTMERAQALMKSL